MLINFVIPLRKELNIFVILPIVLFARKKIIYVIFAYISFDLKIFFYCKVLNERFFYGNNLLMSPSEDERLKKFQLKNLCKYFFDCI